MKIEYLAEGSADCPLVRIYSPRAGEFAALFAAVSDLGSANSPAKLLSELVVLEQGGGLDLRMIVNSKNESVRFDASNHEVTWSLSSEGWQLVADWIEPFCESSESNTYQWLAGPHAGAGLINSDISILIASGKSGSW